MYFSLWESLAEFQLSIAVVDETQWSWETTGIFWVRSVYICSMLCMKEGDIYSKVGVDLKFCVSYYYGHTSFFYLFSMFYVHPIDDVVICKGSKTTHNAGYSVPSKTSSQLALDGP